MPPPVVVDNASVDGESVMANGKNIMQPGRGAFDIRFAALSFNAPEKVRYRYRLVGYDSAWVDAGSQHAASYTNLPPGTYTFEVTACNDEGVATATVGASRGAIDSPAALIAAADSALYRSKHSGKNRVIAYTADSADAVRPAA